MNVSRIRPLLKKGKRGTFRPLWVGEAIEPGDIVVMDCWVESPSETSVGKPATEKDTIVRLEFEK